MSSHQPGPHEAPDTVSFLALVRELERRSRASADPQASFSITLPSRPLEEMERDALHKQLLDLEHHLEKRILCQLEGALVREVGVSPLGVAGMSKDHWVTRIRRLWVRLILKVRDLAMGSNPFLPDSASLDNREHQV